MPPKAQSSAVAGTSSKRPADDLHDKNAPKRARTLNARTILAQSSEAGLKNGHLDVGTFVASRKFEIQQLAASMKKSKSIQKQQTFQAVPRSLRRRAASHHTKFLPPRFRAQAIKEMRASGVELAPKKRQRITRLHLRRETANKLREFARRSHAYHQARKRSNFPVGINELASKVVMEHKYKRRQKDKTWLPTHLWNAKRAHFVQKWGYAIPSHPNEKVFRPTHRHSQHSGCVIFDTTYYSTMVLQGDIFKVPSILEFIMGERVTAKSYLIGDRAFEGAVNSEFQFFDRQRTMPANMGEILVYQEPPLNESSKARAMIRVHPSIFKSTWDALMKHTEENNKENPDMLVELLDYRYAVGSIDVFGGKALKILGHNLRVMSGQRSNIKAWHTAIARENPTSLPRGSVIPINLYDPRTYSVSSKERSRSNWKHDPYQSREAITNVLSRSGAGAKTTLFEPDGRRIKVEHNTLAHIRLKQRKAFRSRTRVQTKDKSFFRRALFSLQDDVAIPALVIRRANGGLTIMLPIQWVAIFYKKLIIPSYSMFGGLDQYAQILAENKLPCFPIDYPGTEAGRTEAKERAEVEREAWKRRPRSKKMNYDALDLKNGDKKGEVGDPFTCDWDYLLKTDPSQPDQTPWMLHRFEAFLRPRDELVATTFIAKALFTVQLTMVGRGRPLANARVYWIPQKSRRRWMKTKSDRTIVPESRDYPVCPKAENLMGFVTSGGFNLKDGKGTAIASLSWARVDQGCGFQIRYCIVRNVGDTVGRLAFYTPVPPL
ncbi:ribonucleases P/MRP protein subunit POP1-domain-containing protein [Lipomyces arxii]|uniref:ribonucleases P/MRP protein subunit POP1-domain-containing protein n=1 Tax=Lipomyces arxii TaxID=56418 RepID=UPI0034CD9C97